MKCSAGRSNRHYVGIEGASFINSYARPNALRLTAANGLGTTLNEATARLLSRREGIGVVLAGGIDRYRNGYNVSVKAIDPAAEKKATNETFIVGRDYRIWHFTRGDPTWRPLGGGACKTAPNGAYQILSGVATIQYYAKYPKGTCTKRIRSSGTWSSGQLASDAECRISTPRQRC